MRADTLRYKNTKEAAEACGARVLELLADAIVRNGRAMLAISGGSSPRPMFEFFARSEFDWSKVHLFWVDERGVPPHDPQSNFKLASDTWLDAGRFPAGNVHRIRAELDPHEAARRYVDELRGAFGIVPGDIPEFDVIHQGMGGEGHTASLFPGEPLIADRHEIAAAVWVEKVKQWRITLLPAVLMAAHHTLMLVSGTDKAEALRAVMDGPYEPQVYPAQIVSRNGRDVEWFVDF